MLIIVAAWLAVAAGVFVALFFVTAPYGRYARRGWGPTLPARWGWLAMEAPAALVFAAGFVVGPCHNVTAWVFLGLWLCHYGYRAFIYPFTLREGDRRMPVAVAAMAVIFNAVNAWLNAWWLFDLSGGHPASWLLDPRFLIGTALFVIGMAITRSADATLRRLRSDAADRDGYSIPQGALYRRITSPNYLGEIVEWIGWAVLTWSLPGLAFAAWTAANLAPRARANQRWYRERFPDYPPERRALIPGVW